MKKTTFTATYTGNQYSDDWFEEEIMRFVGKTKKDDDALTNLRRIMRQYHKRKGAWFHFKKFIKYL